LSQAEILRRTWRIIRRCDIFTTSGNSASHYDIPGSTKLGDADRGAAFQGGHAGIRAGISEDASMDAGMAGKNACSTFI
jgi:hypothetical protein